MPVLECWNIFCCKISFDQLWPETKCPSDGGPASLEARGPATVHLAPAQSWLPLCAWSQSLMRLRTWRHHCDTRSAFCVIKEFAVTNLIRGFCHEGRVRGGGSHAEEMYRVPRLSESVSENMSFSGDLNRHTSKHKHCLSWRRSTSESRLSCSQKVLGNSLVY